MKVLVHTPTRLLGGLDCNHLSLTRQVLPPDTELIWSVADEYYALREWELDMAVGLRPDIRLYHYKLPIKRGMLRNLAHSYSYALDLAKYEQADLFISLQDYFWLPEDAIAKFIALNQQYPNDLLTGTAHLMSYPDKSCVPGIYKDDDGVITGGGYTVFGTPWYEQPSGDYFFRDPRPQNTEEAEYRNPIEWETNWAAVPKIAIDSPIRFTEAYDVGAAYENQDFALQCEQNLGCGMVFDPNNIAWGINHKRLWPEIEAADMPHLNHKMHNERWF